MRRDARTSIEVERPIGTEPSERALEVGIVSDKDRSPQKSNKPSGFDKFIALLTALGGGAGIVALLVFFSGDDNNGTNTPNGTSTNPTEISRPQQQDSSPTPPTTPPTTPSTARVAILEPSDDSFFDARQDEIEVKVRIFSRSEHEDLWLVSNPAAGKTDWQPQCNLADRQCSTPLGDGVFSSQYWIGNQKSIHDIYVMSADRSANLAFKNYLSKAQATHEWSGMALPDGTTQLARVKITVE